MIIDGHKSTEIGDVMIVQAQTPVIGVVSLVDYHDDTVGETSLRYFDKEFRYSVDGVNFSIWMPLTQTNIQSIVTNPTIPFRVEYRYSRAGTDTSGVLEFNSITLQGIYTSISCGDAYDSSVFPQFFSCTNPNVLNWCSSVMNKLYRRGIVAEYIERGIDGNNYNEDEDYISFWKSVVCFFAYIVIYTRQIADWSGVYDLMKDYLAQRDMNLCDSMPQIDLLNYIHNYYNEIRRRGTSHSFDKDRGGEFLKTICYNECDEFIAALYKFNGWSVDRSSPISRDTNYERSLIKLWEKCEEVADLSLYPLQESSNISIQNSIYGKPNTSMVIDLDSVSNRSGIGQAIDSGNLDIIDLSLGATPIKPTISYEITFWMLLNDSASTIQVHMDFGVHASDCEGNEIYLLDINGNTKTDKCFISDDIELRGNKWYFMRGVVYGNSVNNMIQDLGVSGITSYNLKFPNCDAITSGMVKPFIQFKQKSGVKVHLYDIKMRPLNTVYSAHGFVSGNLAAHIWYENHNTKFRDFEVAVSQIHPLTGDRLISIPKLEEFARRKLLPYNVNVFWNNLRCNSDQQYMSSQYDTHDNDQRDDLSDNKIIGGSSPKVQDASQENYEKDTK